MANSNTHTLSIDELSKVYGGTIAIKPHLPEEVLKEFTKLKEAWDGARSAGQLDLADSLFEQMQTWSEATRLKYGDEAFWNSFTRA